MDQSTVRLLQCLLCRGVLPAKKGDIFINHLQEQHRTFFNLEFLFVAFKLPEKMIKETIEFMEDRIDVNANNLETEVNKEIKTFKIDEEGVTEAIEEENMHKIENQLSEERNQELEKSSLKPKQLEDIKQKKRKTSRKIQLIRRGEEYSSVIASWILQVRKRRSSI